jgi:Putative Flp pilus-assembly TadE/G-like/von Willebrand factor type A domain
MPLLAIGMLVVLIGFSALAVDVGRAYFAKRQLQASADAAALAGAQVLPDISAATNLAQQYGPAGDNPPQEVQDVQTGITTECLPSAIGCDPANAVVVTESGQVPTIFAKLFGIDNFTVHAEATACSPCGQKPLDVMLVLDRTGSMCTTSTGAPDPACTDLNNARNGMKTFLSLMDPEQDHVGLAVLPPATSVADRCGASEDSSYDSTASPYVVVPLSDDYMVDGSLNTTSDLVSTINCIQAGGRTSYATAIDDAQAELVADGRPGVQKVIVFLSDGAANYGPSFYPDTSPYRETPCHQGGASAAAAAAATDTLVYAIGYDLGHDVCKGLDPKTGQWVAEVPAITSEEALQGIAGDPSRFYDQPTAGELNTIYTSVAADLLYGHSKLVDDAN